MKHKNTQPLYIFNRENPQNSEPQNGPRRGLDFIALTNSICFTVHSRKKTSGFTRTNEQPNPDATFVFVTRQSNCHIEH